MAGFLIFHCMNILHLNIYSLGDRHVDGRCFHGSVTMTNAVRNTYIEVGLCRDMFSYNCL